MGLKRLSVHGSKYNPTPITPEGKDGLCGGAVGHHGLLPNPRFPQLLLGVLHSTLM